MDLKPKAILRFCSRADIFFYLLIWLMVLLVIGTILQKYIGLYQSQKIYFSSFILWVGGVVPLPGGYATLAAIFVNLFAKLFVEKWTKEKLGTVIIHCGALLLLIGGFLTAEFSSEGNMVIDEGARSNYVADYHARELVIINVTDPDVDQVTAFGPSWLKPGAVLSAETIPFTLKVERFCRHCGIIRRNTPSQDSSVHGMLMMNDIRPLPLLPEDESNRSGVIVKLEGAGSAIDGRYGIFEFMPIDQYIAVGDQRYLITLRRQRTYLPFSVELIDFDKQVYPGTSKARSYQSEVILRDGDLEWRSLISMNNPLRYKGYTFFQSSFVEADGQQTTVLAVVKNIGKIFPYISSIIICFGLLVHMMIRIPKLTSDRREKAA